MTKRIFSPNQQRRESRLGCIVFSLLILLGLFYGGVKLAGFLGSSSGQTVAEQGTIPVETPTAPVTVPVSAPENPAVPASAPAPQSAQLVQAESQFKAGNLPRARELYEAAVRDLAQSADYPAAALGLARVLQKEGQRDRAMELFTEVRDRAPAPLRAGALLGFAADAEAQGEKVKARDLYKQAFNDAERNGDIWNEALDRLGALNVELIFSPQETPDSKYHTIEPGESITSIGIKLNTTQGLLMRANNIVDPATLRAGQRLKHTPKDFRILVERSTCRMFLLDSDGVFKRYGTGLGMPGYETTLGKYTIGNKQKDPTWFKPGSAPIPAGDPGNELGTRWMPLMPQEEGLPTDLGIHGTIEPETIGQYKSHGCPRMKKEDVEELYDLVVRSTPVQIVEVIDWATMGPADATLS